MIWPTDQTYFLPDEVTPLWPPGSVPDYRAGDTGEEVDGHLYRVGVPTLEVYRPPAEAPAPALVICPGGGYRFLSREREGRQVARWLNGLGIAAFVLNYRLPDATLTHDPTTAPARDGAQALRLVRQRATHFGVDAARVGTMGFSAGGHLTALLAAGNDPAGRPDVSVLIYAVVTMAAPYTHFGTREQLLGPQPTLVAVEAHSADLRVDARVPPTLLVHSSDDESVPVENSLRYYEALLRHDVPAGLHVYPTGGHGYGLADALPGGVSAWPQACAAWLAQYGWRG